MNGSRRKLGAANTPCVSPLNWATSTATPKSSTSPTRLATSIPMIRVRIGRAGLEGGKGSVIDARGGTSFCSSDRLLTKFCLFHDGLDHWIRVIAPGKIAGEGNAIASFAFVGVG